MKLFFIFYFLFIFGITFSQEICNNGIDDDGDGLIDLNDTEECYCDSIIVNEVPSLIPNPSFEGYSCCPDEYSQLNCANTWIQASQATSDYFNTCGFTGVAPIPFPDGNGAAGVICNDNYSEYIGACLSSAMHAGVSYQIQFDLAFDVINELGEHSPIYPVELPPIDFTIYGTTSCSDLPFMGTTCPVGYGNWQELGTVSVTPDNIHGVWANYSITVTSPSHIYAIALGGPCTYPAGGEYNAGTLNPSEGQMMPSFFVDNLILNESSLWGIPITVTGDYCNEDLVLSVSTNAIETVQWYYDGVAIDGEFLNTLEISANGYDLGHYTVVVSDMNNCATGEISIVSPEIDIYPIDNITSCNEIYLPAIVGENLTGNQNYYTQPGGNGDIVTSPITVAQMIYAYDNIGNCEDEESFFVYPNNSPDIFAASDIHECGSYTLPAISGVNLTGGQNYYTGPHGTGGIVSSPVTTSQLVYMYDGSSECSDEESFNISIYDTPDIFEVDEIFGCNSIDLPTINGANLTGSQNYYTATNGQGSVVTSPITHSQIIYAFDENAYCSDNEEINITIYQDLPTFAGDDVFSCENSVVLQAIPSIQGSSGTWTGPAVINNPNQDTTLVTNSYGTYTYYWEESYETCVGLDSVTVSFIESPTPSIFITRDTVCTNEYVLHVDNVNYEGMWAAYNAEDSTLLIPQPFYSPSIYSPDVNVTIGNFDNNILEVIFVWTEQNQIQGSVCSSSVSTTISFARQPVASVGATDEAEVCGLEYTELSANMTGSEWAMSEWISPEVSCLFGDCSLAQTSVSLLNDGVFGDSAYVRIPFVWTVKNYACTDIDTLWVEFYQQPNAFAGLDDAVCGKEYELDAVFDIQANENYSPSGWWSTDSEFIDIDDVNQASTHVTAGWELGLHEFVFRENNSNLTYCYSEDTVVIEFLEIPVIDAGEDTFICGDCTELSAINSEFYGNWIHTPGADFFDYNDPNTEVCVPTDGGEFVFSWMESNTATTSNLSCTSIDEVVYTFYKMPNARILIDDYDTIACGLEFSRLRAENPGSGITGYWYCEGAGVDFGDPFSIHTWVNVPLYEDYDFYWIEESGEVLGEGYCIDTAGPVKIYFNENPVANAGQDTLFCGLTGNFNAIPSVGQGVWSTPSEFNIIIDDNNDPNTALRSEIYNTDDGNLEVYIFNWIEDNGGCTDSESIEVVFARIPESDVVVIPPKCFGELATISASDQEHPQYSWNFYEGEIQEQLQNEIGGKYQNFVSWDNGETEHRISLMVTNEWGCMSPITIDTVYDPILPNFDFTVVPDTCLMNRGGVVINDTADISYFWLDDETGSYLGSSFNEVLGLSEGSYSILSAYMSPNLENYSYYIETFGTANCFDTLVVDIEPIGLLNAEFELNASLLNETLVAPNAIAIFANLSEFDNVSRVCEWHFDDGTTTRGCDDIIEHQYEQAGCYEPYLVISNRDLKECRDTAYLPACVMVENASSIEIPNIFSPNGDGVNDYFQVKASTLSSFNGAIVNRWGENVFEWINWQDYDAGWDGKLKTGSKASPGVYYYVIKAVGLDKEEYEYNGVLHLVGE